MGSRNPAHDRRLRRVLTPVDPPTVGGVYFLRAGDRIKIGCASNIDRRMRDLQVGSADDLRLLAWMPGGPVEERAAHERFRAHHVRGEWFDLTGAIISYVAWVRGGCDHRFLPMLEVAGEILDGRSVRHSTLVSARRALSGDS